ncbi:MAG: metallopeptidase TldD-related protein [Acidimicrobiales bacterium]
MTRDASTVPASTVPASTVPAGDAPERLAEQALGISKADGCVVIVERGSEANLRFANNTVTTDGLMRSLDVTVISVVRTGRGTCVGTATAAGAATVAGREGGVAGIEEVVRASEQAARHAGPAEDPMELVEGTAEAAFDNSEAELELAALAGLADDLGGAFDRWASAGRALFGYAEQAVTCTYLASSTGLRRAHCQPRASLELTVRDRGGSRSEWVGRRAEHMAELRLGELDRELERRVAWGQRRLELGAGKYPVLLPPSAVADLMIYLYWSAAARDAAEGRSVFSAKGGGTRIGERLSALPLSLVSDPTAPGVSCAPFLTASSSGATASVFDNGLPVGRTEWVREGRLDALVHTRATARRSGETVTPLAGNLMMEMAGQMAGGPGGVAGAGPSGGPRDELAEMVAAMGNGLVLTCLWYIREVDPATLLLTGLTRDGVYLVEGGEVVGAVNNFRFNESPVSMLARVEAAGSTARTFPREWGEYFGPVAMPPLVVDGFNMSSVSQAL